MSHHTYLKAASKEFIIGVEDVSYFPLFDFKTHRNTFSRELLDTFAKSKGYKFTYLPLPIKRFERWLMVSRSRNKEKL